MQIKIRRFSGGGAVYHDEGNLNFSVITSQSNIKRIKYYDLILKAVEKFGIKAEFNGRNDLITQDKKFSGNAINIEAMRNALIELTGAAPLLTPVNEHKRRHRHRLNVY